MVVVSVMPDQPERGAGDRCLAGDAHRFVSLLTCEAADELGPEPGMLAVAAVNPTGVSVEIPGD